MLVAAIAPHSNVASRTLPAFRGGEAEITRNRTDFIKTLQVHPSLADLAAGNRMAAELTLRGSLQNGAAPGALPADSVHPPFSFPVNFFKPIGAASRTAAVTSDLTFKPIGAAPDAELLSFGETTGTTRIGDDSVPTVGVTGGGAAAPLKALWRAGPPDAQPLTELCTFENLIEGEEATVARFVTTEAGFTTATAHSKIEADEPDTKAERETADTDRDRQSASWSRLVGALVLALLCLLRSRGSSSSASKPDPIKVEGQKRAKKNEEVVSSAGVCRTPLAFCRTHRFYLIGGLTVCAVAFEASPAKYNPTVAAINARGRSTLPAVPSMHTVPASWAAALNTGLVGAGALLLLGRVALLPSAAQVRVAAAALLLDNAAADPRGGSAGEMPSPEMSLPLQRGFSSLEHLLESFHCRDIYMDVGTNIGVQIRKVYEPHYYQGANMIRHFDSLFGPKPRCGVCTIGLEPNPRHATRLDSLTKHLQDAGAGVLVLRGAALDKNSSIELHQIDSDNSRWDLAASVYSPTVTGRRKELVPAYDLAALVGRLDQHVSGTGGSLMMKMDVEGAEQILLPHLLNSRRPEFPGQSLICAIDEIYIEWHHHNQVLRLSDESRESIAQLREQIGLLFATSTGAGRPSFLRRCTTKVLSMDDETFGFDGADFKGNGGFPLPEQPICPPRSPMSHRDVPISTNALCFANDSSLSDEIACEELKRKDLFSADFLDNCIHSDCPRGTETLPVEVAGKMSDELRRTFNLVGSRWGKKAIKKALAMAAGLHGTIRGATLFAITNNQSRCLTENYLIHLSRMVANSDLPLFVMLFCDDSEVGRFCLRLRHEFGTERFKVGCIVPQKWTPPNSARFKSPNYNRLTYLRQAIGYILLLVYKQPAVLWNDIDYVWRKHPSLLVAHMLDGAPGALGAGVREDTTGRINGGLAFFSTAGTNYLRRWISRIEPQLHMDQDHEPFQFGRIALGSEEDVHTCRRGAGLYAQHFTCCSNKVDCMKEKGVWKAGRLCEPHLHSTRRSSTSTGSWWAALLG